MKTWDLHTSTAKLDLAMQSLQKARHATREEWDDQTRRDFEESYLEPLKPTLRKALDAIHRLQSVLSKAERDVDSY